MKSKNLLTTILCSFVILSSFAKNTNDLELTSQKSEISKKIEARMQSSVRSFEKNNGQFTEDFKYRFSSSHASVDFYTDRILFSLRKVIKPFHPTKVEEEMEFDYVNWEIELVNSNLTDVEANGELIKSNIHYFDKNGQGINKSTTREIIYKEIYPNIDLVFYTSKTGHLKYDFILKEGALLSDIKLRYKHVKNLRVSEAGELIYDTKWGEMKEDVPFSYKLEDKENVSIKYHLDNDILSFTGINERIKETVVLDPVYVDWSTYFYGNGSNGSTWNWTRIFDLDMDADDNVYVTGFTNDVYPGISGSYSTTPIGFYDAFVCKLAPAGDSIIWFSYLGGNSIDYSLALGVNNDQEPVVGGFTRSDDFPTTANAYDQNYAAGSFNYKGFVTKFAKDGATLIFSTYLGGSQTDLIQSLVLDNGGNVYVTGRTSSTDYPVTTGAYQTTYAGSSSGSWWNGGDVFLTKILSDGSDLDFSTYLGGNGDETGYQVAISPNNDIYVVGSSSSTNFPVTPGSRIFNPVARGVSDGFITKFNSTGNTVSYSKLMGGSGEDWFEGVYVNERDEAYVAGISRSGDFYTSRNAYQDRNRGGADAVVVKFNPGGSNVLYSTYIGGSSDETNFNSWLFNNNIRIAATVREEAMVCGLTKSNNFPVTSDALMTTNPSAVNAGSWNSAATIFKLDFRGSKLLYGTYYGGSSFEYPGANKLKRISCFTNILYGGFTNSNDYPTTPGVFKENISATGNFWTGFISKFRDTLYTDEINLSLTDTVIECDEVFDIVDAENRGADIIWSDGYTRSSRIIQDTGTYWVQATYGCDTVRDTISYVLEYSPKLPVLPEDTTYCDRFPTIKLDAYNDSVDATFEWSTGGQDSVIFVSDSGAYWVDIITPNCGTDRDLVVFDFKRTPNPELQDSVFCDDVALTLTAGDSLGNAETYVWNTGDSASTVFIDSVNLYKVVVSNICGVDSAQADISILYTPEIILPLDSEFCNTISYTLDFGRGLNEEDYSITDLDAGTILNTNNNTYEIVTASTFEIRAENRCGSSYDTITTTLLTTPDVDLGDDDTLCDIVLVPKTVGTTNNKEIYTWDDNSNSDQRILLNAGTYWVEANNKCGSDRDSIILTMVRSPQVTLPQDSTFCNTVNLTLDAYNTEPSLYTWNTGSTDSAIVADAPGWYKVVVSNYCGSVADSIEIGLITSPEVSLGQDLTFCNTVTPVDFTIGQDNNEEEYIWSDGTDLSQATFASPGKHWVQISNKCDIVSDTVEFILSYSPDVTLIPDTTLCGNFSLTLDAGNPGMEYLWMPYGETTQTIQATEQLVYSVTVTNEYGCEGTGQMEVRPDCISKSFLPTAFSPNGDGLNDVFKPTLINYEAYSLQIFNRWGELIFESDDLNQGWDGTFQGKPVQQGVYTYIVSYITTEDMMPQNVGGVLTVVR